MNKMDLIAEVAGKAGLTKTAATAAVESMIEAIKKSVKKEPVQLVGFGTFSVIARKARKGVNPATGAKIKIPAKKVLKFKPSKTLIYK